MSSTERWIVGILLAALGWMHWTQVHQVSEGLESLEKIVSINSSRIAVVEQRAIDQRRDIDDMKGDLKAHRAVTERK